MCKKNKDGNNAKQLKKALAEFRRPLIKMGYLSERLNYPGFTKRFRESLEILESNLNDIEKAKRLLVKTEIVGGMGTWMDSLPWTAHQLGISNEFDETTSRFSITRSEIKKWLKLTMQQKKI